VSIYFDSNLIRFDGALESGDIFRFSQILHAVQKRGYSSAILDFTNVTLVFETFMVPAIALCRNEMAEMKFSIRSSSPERVRSLFHNSNWNYLLNPVEYDESTFAGTQHLPAQSYRTGEEQKGLVDRMMDVILGSLVLQRKNLAALEWSINEITDNVLNHSQSRFGGVIQASTFSQTNSVEFVVADAGIGIPRSLGIKDDRQALARAIQEGVTRDKKNNQGNGLYGSYRVAAISGGRFEIHSGKATLLSQGVDKVKTSEQLNRVFHGTSVSSKIVCSNESLIEQALVFKGQIYHPSNDYLEAHYELGDERQYVFLLKKEAPGFGTREAGRIVGIKLANLLLSDQEYNIVLDFSDIGIISSSFADEAIAKPYVQLGPTAFISRVNFRNIDRTIRALIDRAILLRSRQPDWQEQDLS
jgi:anti-sigma regulatory factor (Ser/Thr protein kinase)